MSDDQNDNEDSPLNHIVDDLSARSDVEAWVAARLIDNRLPADLIADLVSHGHSENEATIMVEEVRRRTRAWRGILTGRDVRRDADRRYHLAMELGGLLPSTGIDWALRLAYSIASLVVLRRIVRRAREQLDAYKK